MARTLTLTADEWAVLERDREAWIVRPADLATSDVDAVGRAFAAILERGRGAGLPHLMRPPAELVDAAAPCEGETVTCHCGCDGPCPDCRITLLGECPECHGRQCLISDVAHYGRPCETCRNYTNGTVTLGCAYAASEVQMIWRPGVPAEGTQWATLVAMLGFDPSADIGRYALKVRLA